MGALKKKASSAILIFNSEEEEKISGFSNSLQNMNTNISCYDRLKEAKIFDDSKMGVKGLVDSGITTIPRFFIHPPENLIDLRPPTSQKIPTIDLSGFHSNRRSEIVRQIHEASSEFGFFLVVNHGIPILVMEGLISAVKGFHEQSTEEKMVHYRRTNDGGVSFNSNSDLFRSKAASWRDTLWVQMGGGLPDWEQVPAICRKELLEWEREVRDLGKVLMGLLSEGLGLDKKRLEEVGCLEGEAVLGHYYPYCPEPELTVGIASHTDPGTITVLMQNGVDGLQVKLMEEWVQVNPPHGALIINIGDLLQIMSNDEYKSAEHRALANSLIEPRISIATPFRPTKEANYHGPLPELISQDRPPLYRNFSMSEFMKMFFSKDLSGMVNHFKL